MQNATYLFEKPFRHLKHSESRWTAVAQMSLVYIKGVLPQSQLPVYNTDSDGYLKQITDLCVDRFDEDNTICEQKLSGKIFNINNFSMNYHHICPDIINVRENYLTMIEVKTLSESVRRNIDRYNQFKIYIQDQGWTCDLYYLLSHGHGKVGWDCLAKHESKIILWEDLFEAMSNTPLSRVIGGSLHEYCERPFRRDQPGDAPETAPSVLSCDG